MTQKTDKTNNDDRSLYFMTGLFVLATLWKKYNELKPVFMQWINNHLWLISTIAAVAGLTLTAFGYATFQVLHDRRRYRHYLASVTAEQPGSVYLGRDSTGKDVFIPMESRKMHTEVIGTTNAGKSESVIIPWAVSDMRDMRGFVIIDGKADKSFISKLYAYALRLKRGEDFKVFSLQDPDRSLTFNPLMGGTPEEVAERVFNSFEFENPYYRSVQYEVFSKVLRIFDTAHLPPTFLRVYQAIKHPPHLHELAVRGGDPTMIQWATYFKSLAPADRDERTSGLLAAISHFAFGSHAKLFNTDQPDIDLDQALREDELVYFQLPVMKAPFLGKATGKLVLQCFQSAVANRHRTQEEERRFFSVYLDDFTEYLYPGFVSLLNKSRSANIGVVFAHQSIGDIKVLGDDVATSILTNSNLKVVMRGNDPDSAEYFSKVIGTKTSTQTTERTEKGFMGNQSRTGDGSVREVEEFIVHPNIIKRNLGVGEGFVIIPHRHGTKTVKVKFEMLPKLPEVEMPAPKGKPVLGLNIGVEANGTVQKAEIKNKSTQVAFATSQGRPEKEAS